MAFDTVKDFLRESLLPQLRDSHAEIARHWIDRLGPSDESDLLGCSIAIDIKSGSLPASVVATILCNLESGESSPRKAFADATKQCGENLKCRSTYRAAGESLTSTTYANVLDFTAFLQSYLIPTYPYLTPDDLDLAKESFFGTRPRSEPISLEELTGTFEGPDGLVWVSPDALHRSRTENLTIDAASTLHDSLGLGDTWRGEMVYITYPHEFAPVGCARPTSLDCSWEHGGHCFLSAPGAGSWGKTHGRSRAAEAVPERIHGPISALSVGFSAQLLEEPVIEPRDVDSLRLEALTRFEV